MGTELAKRTVSAQMLLESAHLSPNEIEQKTGIPAIEAAQRLNDLLDSRDWLSQRRQEQLLIIQMEDLIRKTNERLDDASNEEFAGIANVAIRGMKEVGIRFDARRKLLDVDITEITRAQAHTFGGAYDAALNYLIETLLVTHPDITRTEIYEIARDSLLMAKKKLEDSIGED